MCQHTYPEISFQTMTAAYAYPYHINLDKLSELVECYYNPESFPAVQVRRYKPIHVNVFHSGKVTITGLKDLDTAKFIEYELDCYVCCSLLV